MALDYINIRSLTMEELVGLVNLYPWFGAARRELCERMVRSGTEGWGKEQFANAALYIGARSIISDIVRAARKTDWKDKDVDALLKSFIAPKEEEPKSDVRVVGGDFFTQAQYDGVRREGDNVFSHYAARAAEASSEEGKTDFEDSPFCTETLAQIYAEQGYYEQSRKIYSRLSLRYPEKSAYFASLIEKLDN